MDTLRRISQRHSGIVILTISLIFIFVLLILLRNIILPFLIAIVLAYLIFPVVHWLEREFPKQGKWGQAKRILSIVIVFAMLTTTLIYVGFYLVTTTVESVISIVNNAPNLISVISARVLIWIASLRDWLPAEMSQQLDNFTVEFGQNLGITVQNTFKNIAVQVPSTISYIMGFAILPIFLFYILKDHEYLNNKFYDSLPENTRKHVRNIASIINEVLGGYIHSQLMLGLFVGILALIGLLIIQAPFAFGLALIAGMTELVPIIGPWIGGGIAALVVLAIDPSKVIWVILLFLGVQLIENNLLVPRIQGHYLHVHPAIAIVLIVIGVSIAGFWGLILAVPLASTLVKLYEYTILAAKEEDED